MSRKFNDHLDLKLTREGFMRFKGEMSQIQCFAHVLNLIVKDILADLSSCTNKDDREFLDQAVANKWKTITLPRAAGVVACVQLQVL
jgi:hypothetical protein